MPTLDGKIALVTGAGSGIGAAIADRFARAGAHVVATDLNEAMASETERRLRAAGGAAESLRLDVTNEADAQRVAGLVHARHQHLDILVNNAGIGHVGTILQASGEDLDRLYAVNVRGVFNVTRAFLPAMIARRAGAIVNIASIAGIVGLRDRLAYCTTKFAVVGLTKAVALDHALEGVRVNCICPGRVETPFVTARLREYPDPEQAYREMAASQAVGRMGRPEEIAAAAEYLASDDAAFITGSALIIDGGLSAGK
jgi:NAD(P)-dependent dehydrogenase (short-subunit alcohol dehydrogenase family)